MRNFKNLILTGIFASVAFVGCNSDDDTPVVVNEEEVITTLRLTLTDGTNTFQFESQDLDGDGPDAPVISTPDLSLQASTTYTGSVLVLNETESPAENITEEVENEGDEHQFFYTPGGEFSFADFNYLDFDVNGDPLGIDFNFTTGETQGGTLTVTLRHELEKPNDGLASAGGDTDIEVTFPVTVE